MNRSKWLNSLIQITLILLASLVVVGATWQLGNSEGAQTAFERGPDRPDGERPERGESEGRRGGDPHAPDLSLRGIAGFAETLIKLVVVMSAVLFGQRAWGALRARMT